MRKGLAVLLSLCVTAFAHAAANITLTSAALAADGRTFTATVTGGTGSGYAIASAAGFTISAGGLRHTITAQSITGTTLTMTLGFPVGSGWTAPTFTTTVSATITDDGGNTSQAQTAVAFTNNSTKTVTAYPSTNSAFGIFGLFGNTSVTGGRNFSPNGSAGTSSTGFAFAATGTDIGFIGFANAASGYGLSVDGAAYSNTNLLPSSAVGAAAVIPIGVGLSDTSHEINVAINNGYYDLGTAATAPQVQGTVLVVGSAPAIAVANSGAWGIRYFFGDSPFTDVVSGSDTKGRIDRLTSTTQTTNSKTGYWLEPGARIRFASNSSSIALWGHQNSQKYVVYQDGVQVGSVFTAGSGSVFRRMLLVSGLDTTSTHEYEIFKVDLSNSAMYLYYVELNGSGIASVAHAEPFIEYEYGDSRTVQSTYLTNLQDGHTLNTGRVVAGHWESWLLTGSGQRVTTYFRDNTASVPAGADRVWIPAGVNDISAGAVGATFQNDYETMLENIRTQIGAGKRILAIQPLPASGINEALRATAATSIQAAIAATGDSEITFIPTDGWITRNVSHTPDGVHFNTLGYAQYLNRQKPIAADTAITLSGPSTGQPNAASTNFTVTLAAGATFCGDQTITLGDGGNGGTFTPSVGSPGVSSVSVTPSNGATSFTFTYTPASAGTKTLTPTSNQAGWTMPSAASYVATGGVPQGMFFTDDDVGRADLVIAQLGMTE